VRTNYEKRPPNAAHNPDSKRYLTAAQLRWRYGNRSEMWLARIMRADPDFPRPIHIGRFRFWDLADIEAYERNLAARREPAEIRGRQRAP
jgi:predicted DNA-binding transcriptional regulator AlpA